MKAGELDKGAEEVGIAFVADEEPPIVAQPGDGPFDFPPLAIAFEHTSVLGRMPFPSAFAMRTDQLNSVLGQAIAERITVGRTVVNQPRSMFVENMLIQE
jgi:hypothetical protein